MPNRITKNPVATCLKFDDGKWKYIYHDTVVVTYDPSEKKVTLNSGGYRTNTTKHRMNQFAIERDLNYSVFSEKQTWYVRVGNHEKLLFEDGITFNC